MGVPSSYPHLLSSRDGESDDMLGYLMVIYTFLASRDDESDEMRGYPMVIRTFCQLEESEPVDTQRLMS